MDIFATSSTLEMSISIFVHFDLVVGKLGILGKKFGRRCIRIRGITGQVLTRLTCILHLLGLLHQNSVLHLFECLYLCYHKSNCFHILSHYL